MPSIERACSSTNLNATTFFSYRWSEGALRFCERGKTYMWVPHIWAYAHTHAPSLCKYASGSVSAYGFSFSTIKHIHAYIFFYKMHAFRSFFSKIQPPFGLKIDGPTPYMNRKICNHFSCSFFHCCCCCHRCFYLYIVFHLISFGPFEHVCTTTRYEIW